MLVVDMPGLGPPTSVLLLISLSPPPSPHSNVASWGRL